MLLTGDTTAQNKSWISCLSSAEKICQVLHGPNPQKHFPYKRGILGEIIRLSNGKTYYEEVLQQRNDQLDTNVLPFRAQFSWLPVFKMQKQMIYHTENILLGFCRVIKNNTYLMFKM